MNVMKRRGLQGALGVFAVLAGALTVASPAIAQPMSNPAPVIYSFTGTPGTLAYKGGTVTFTAKMKYASICDLSVSPGLTGLPSRSTCTSDAFSKKVTIPADNTGSSRSYTFSFTVQDAAGTTRAANVVIGEGNAPPPISFTPTSLVFQGLTAVSVPTAPATVTVKNNSTTSQYIVDGYTSGTDAGDFTAVWSGADGCGIYLSPQQTCTFHVTFSPLGTGTRSATLKVLDNSWGTGTYASIGVSGTGAWALASVSLSTINWNTIGAEPDIGVNVTTPPVTETITNSAKTVVLWIGALPIYGAGGNFSDFQLVSGGSCQQTTIDPGKSCTFQLEFTPGGAGARSSKYVVPDNTAAGQTVISLAGTGAFATDEFENRATGQQFVTQNGLPFYDFGTLPVNTSSATIEVTMLNTSGSNSTSNVTLRVNGGGGMSGVDPQDFSLNPNGCSNPSDQELAGTFCNFYINFAPSTTGQRSAVLTLNTNTLAGSFQIQLQGNP
jgi:hypothetical protein